MKIIPKFQQGGYSSFFTVFKPVLTQGSTATTKPASSTPLTTTKSGDDDKITQKQLFDMIKDIDGLDNDMTLIASNLLNAFEMAELTGNESDISKMYMSSLIKMKIANTNKKEFYKVTDSARINGSINLPAISADGKSLVLQNKETGKIVEMSYKDYASNKDNYYMLTNSNLAYLRLKDPQYAFNNSILNILNNGMSFKLFLESVDKAKNALGTSTLEYNGLIDTRSQESALKGLQVLKGLSEDSMIQASGSITTQGLYSYKQFDKTLKEQINALMTYMKRVLPDNLKTWAQVLTGMVDENLALEALLIPYLAAGVSPEHQFDINQVKLTKGSSGDGSGNSDPDKFKLNIVDKFLAGMGDKEDFIINLGSTTSFAVRANTLPLVKMDGDYLGSNSTLLLVTEGMFDSVLDTRSVTMGGLLIDPIFFNKVLLTDGKISSIDFPFIEEDGIIKPDLSPETRAKKEEVEKLLRAKGINTNDKELVKKNLSVINQIYVDNELPPAYNPDGSLKTEKYRRFGVINGRASNKALLMELSDSNPLLLEESNGNALLIYLNSVKEEDWDDNNFLWNGVDHLYKGTIWIPLKVNYQSANANEELSASEAIWLEQLDKALAIRQSLNLGRLLSN